MPRKNRFAPPGYWLHITQRGNDRQRVFLSDADRQYFLDLLAARSQERAVRVAAYTLMSNHFHLVAIGDQSDAISLFMMDLSGLYATYRGEFGVKSSVSKTLLPRSPWKSSRDRHKVLISRWIFHPRHGPSSRLHPQ